MVVACGDEALGAFAHADLPFEKLIEQLQLERRDNRSPLFRTMLVLQDASRPLPKFPGLKVQSHPLELGAAKFDLLLEFTAGGGALRGCVSYSTELFELATIERFVGHLTTLLRGLLADARSTDHHARRCSMRKKSGNC